MGRISSAAAPAECNFLSLGWCVFIPFGACPTTHAFSSERMAAAVPAPAAFCRGTDGEVTHNGTHHRLVILIRVVRMRVVLINLPPVRSVPGSGIVAALDLMSGRRGQAGHRYPSPVFVQPCIHKTAARTAARVPRPASGIARWRSPCLCV